MDKYREHCETRITEAVSRAYERDGRAKGRGEGGCFN